MAQITPVGKEPIDRLNVFFAGLIFAISFVVYSLTVQPTFSFWDCGEFIACSYILGIPHPPGTPLFVIIGRLAAMIPFVEDVSHRVNYLSVISSAFTAMFSYLLTVKLVGYFFGNDRNSPQNRHIAYIAGICGGLFVAFGRTNWANSVEAEVYGLALALSVMIVWLTIKYYEQRGTMAATRIMMIIIYATLLGVGIHMTVFLVLPICSIFMILKKNATPRDWMLVSGFMIFELAMILLFSDGRGGKQMFYLATAVGGAVLLVFLYSKIHWAMAIAIVSVSSIMLSFSVYRWVTIGSIVLLIVLAVLSNLYRWNLNWKAGLAVVFIAFIGVSIHLYIPIRSESNPRIDENNPSRNTDTFMDYLDRKQYGQVSMIDRMFNRRGSLENQFGRHPHMGYYSYFEEQYSKGGGTFLPFLALGIIGLITLARKKVEIGMPLIALLLICSVGLILYMNFADGTRYSFRTGDAYLEVRNRDYFFTPAFVFFGIAIGMGIGAIIQFTREKLGAGSPGRQRAVVMASSVFVLLPAVSLGHNYHANDRSENYIPYYYAKNILDSCEPDAILFTSGDNDTFPLWCIQEVYDYRKDVRVVNLSLLNTDWYAEQMKNRFGVPMSLTDEQILWEKYTTPGVPGFVKRPTKTFHDRPRNRQTYLQAAAFNGRIVKVQDMLIDDIVLANKWKYPIFFTSQPYAESPLNLRSRSSAVGLVYRLDQEPMPNLIDVDKGYDLYMNQYVISGYHNSAVYRDENSTGVFVGVGMNALRVVNELNRLGRRDEALKLGKRIIERYPEYWQSYVILGDIYDSQGDSAKALELFHQLNDTLTAFKASNPENLFYIQDLGLAKVELGRRTNDQAIIDEGISLVWQGFMGNPNHNYGFRKLAATLSQFGQFTELRRAGYMFADYKVNRNDPYLQQLLGITHPTQLLPQP